MRQIYISLAIDADFVPLVSFAMPLSCPLCRVPRPFRAARAAFHAGFPRQPLHTCFWYSDHHIRDEPYVRKIIVAEHSHP